MRVRVYGAAFCLAAHVAAFASSACWLRPLPAGFVPCLPQHRGPSALVAGAVLARSASAAFTRPHPGLPRLALLPETESSNSARASASNSAILQSRSAASTFANCRDDRFVRLACERLTSGVKSAQVRGCSRRSGWSLLTLGTGRPRRTRFAPYSLRPCRPLQSSFPFWPRRTSRTRRSLWPHRTLGSRHALRSSRTKRPPFARHRTQRDQHNCE
jgi:hypothetical protein